MSEINDWTIMFFFASDNELSLLNVSQIKAVKDAGYQQNTDLLLYFDSNQRGVPTRLFNVNSGLKNNNPRRSHIGDGEDPYVRNFLADQIRPYQMDRDKGPCTKTLYDELSQPDGMHVSDALENFIGYCRENNPAKHYMLVLVGHGMIVANDSFLADDNPRSAITLVQLGAILNRFKEKVEHDHASFELLGLHSCSMSAIEIAYEVKDTAKYLIASQGFAYVGSWPYRQLLKKIFNATENNQNGFTNSRVRKLIQSVYELSLYNATDFAFSGYSHDLTLCSLDGRKIRELVVPLVKLTDNLKWSLKRPRGKELILLAHLQSQSFWREEYTDIYDFCSCLKRYCDAEPNDEFQKSLAADCDAVMKVIKPDQQEDPFDGLVIFSDNFGWEYQYAHGLSIYFPWSRPLGNEDTSPLNNYRRYAFYKDFDEGHSWLGFLIDYWKETERPPDRGTAAEYDRMTNVSPHSAIYEAFNKSTLGSYSYENKPTGGYNKPGAGYADSQCLCPSIKNFPTTVKLGRRIRQLSMTPKVQKAFDVEGDDGRVTSP
jgi:hypothetical protein